MTREESIDRLRKISEKTPIRTNGDDLLAITMAIQALEQNESAEEWYKLFVEKLDEQEPCDDAISREAAIEAVKQAIYNHDSAIMRLTELTSVTQKSGKWILGICDNCGYDWGKDAPIASVPNFCPNCGAKMESEDKE